MRDDSRHEPGHDRVILLLLFALFLLLSPLLAWWAADDSPWYAPYLVWALLIALTYMVRRHLTRKAEAEQRDD
ncbi:MAG: hypothetical protein OEZ16_08105 [Chromatiales bacterium]|nr:hypothetical protein [Chromatiales bacterium]